MYRFVFKGQNSHKVKTLGLAHHCGGRQEGSSLKGSLGDHGGQQKRDEFQAKII